jgi:HlyD family secretion protein
MHVRSAVLIVIAAGLLGGGAWYFTRHTDSSYTTATVARGPIVEEVLASGNVESPTTSALHFKTPGKLVALNVATGDTVAAGDVLAEQDTGILDAQLAQAKAGVAAAEAKLSALEEGATPQAIAVSRSALAVAEQTLENAYGTVPNTLADAYAKASDAVVSELGNFFSSPGSANPVLAFAVNDATLSNRIVTERIAAGVALGEWQAEIAALGTATSSREAALQSAEGHLASVRALLSDAVAAVAANIGLSAADTTAYRANASAGLAETNVALAAVDALLQGIRSDRAAVDAAEASLALTSAGATSADIAAQEAAVAAAEANAASIQAEIRDLEIIAPFSGVVTDTDGSAGETITPDRAVVSLIPHADLEVKVNVSEDNIVGVKTGDPARIELDAFPSGTEFAGRVSAVDPAQTVLGGAIYYQTTLLFDKKYPGIRPGMTANVWITTASSTDALTVPASALSALAASTTVRVLENGVPSPRSVTTGIRGQGGMVEILSGLSEGETVITGP